MEAEVTAYAVAVSGDGPVHRGAVLERLPHPAAGTYRFGETLTVHVRPRYVVEVQERVSFARQPERRQKLIEPEVIVVEPDKEQPASGEGVATATAVAPPTVIVPLPVPEEVRECYLRVRDRTSGNPDVPLDLQVVLDTVYDRAGYDDALDYGRAIEPPLSEEDAAWAKQILEAASASAQKRAASASGTPGDGPSS